MIDLTLNQTIGLVVSLTALLPTWILTRKFLQTGVQDYLLFAFLALVSFLVMVSDPVAGITELLAVIQLHNIAIDVAYLLMFLHALKFRWNTPPKMLGLVGVGWFLLLSCLTLSWEPFTQPQSVEWFGLIIPHSFSGYYPIGAGIKFEETIIYSSAFRLIGDSYRLFVLGIVFAIYLVTPLIEDSDEYNKIKRVWLVIWLMFLVHAVLLFPWFAITELVNIFLLIAGALVTYITVKYPDAMLLTNEQILRMKKEKGKVN